MLRTLLALGGLVLALVPELILSVYERYAISAPPEPTARSWVPSYIRAEGIIAIVLAALGGRLYRAGLWFVGAVGVVALAYPRQYLETAGALAYEDGDELEWAGWMPHFVRATGGAVLAVCLLRRQRH